MRTRKIFFIVKYRIHEPDSTRTISTIRLTRLPMGAQYAPATAQYLTSAS
jgi:hypothetical protein